MAGLGMQGQRFTETKHSLASDTPKFSGDFFSQRGRRPGSRRACPLWAAVEATELLGHSDNLSVVAWTFAEEGKVHSCKEVRYI